MEQRLTNRQAAILGAYTGFVFGPFGDIQEYAEEVLGRPIFTDELVSDDVAKQLKDASHKDFLAICATKEVR